MSFDVYVLGFRDGGPAALPGAPAAFRAVFGPHVDRTDPEHGYWHVTAPDGGEADIYADESCDTMLLTHFSFGEVMNLLAEFAKRTNAAILPVGCPHSTWTGH